jgi:hypothetical protein
MSTIKRIQSSRANGARSKGPATPEGKRRSSKNATRHGLLANSIVMEGESRASFDALLAQHVERFQPADGVEFGFIEEMVAAHWRQRRAWAIETRILENRVKEKQAGDEIDRMAAAFTDLAATPGLGLIHRYETRLHCSSQRGLHNFLLVRTAIPNEPSSGDANLPIGAVTPKVGQALSPANPENHEPPPIPSPPAYNTDNT